VAGPIDDATFANLVEMTGGDLAFVDELVDTYLEEGQRLVADLQAAAAAGSVEEMVRPAHSMKSSSLNVGALELGAVCRALEEEARGGQVEDPAARAAAVETGFAEARAELLAELLRR
jgi:HPt (histidine-containing phosphotransfer) domain-containing protein